MKKVVKIRIKEGVKNMATQCTNRNLYLLHQFLAVVDKVGIHFLQLYRYIYVHKC